MGDFSIVCKEFRVTKYVDLDKHEVIWDISERKMGYEYDDVDPFHPGNPGFYGHS